MTLQHVLPAKKRTDYRRDKYCVARESSSSRSDGGDLLSHDLSLLYCNNTRACPNSRRLLSRRRTQTASNADKEVRFISRSQSNLDKLSVLCVKKRFRTGVLLLLGCRNTINDTF